MKIALVVNPFSGNQRCGKLLPGVTRRLKDQGIRADIFHSRFNGHLVKIACKLEIREYDALVAMGGDGTNFHLINGLLSLYAPSQLPPLGILPAGSGNSFAMDLGISNLDEGIEAIIRKQARPVDLISYVQGKRIFYFVNLMGLGFVTDVALTAQRFKAFNDLSYLIGIIHRTAGLRAHHIELEVDGRQFHGPNCFVEFCNSRYTGGNMLMAPEAKIDDGLMDIVITRPLTRKRLLGALPKIYRGSHLKMAEVTYIQGKRARIRTVPDKAMLPDGEILGTSPGVVEVHSQKLRYLSCR